MAKSMNYKTMPRLDILKLFFAVCVVGIHAHLFSENATLYYWVNKSIFRLAVPFFTCASGFLLGLKLTEGEDDGNKAYLVSYSKRLLKLLIIFEPISIVLKCIQFMLEGHGISYILPRVVRSVLFYPWGALWYIQAVLIGVWLVFLWNKKFGLKSGLFAGALLYSIALLCNSYYWTIEGSVLQRFVDLYLKGFDSARNAFFFGFFFLQIGILCSKVSIKYPCGMLTGTFGLYLVELFLVRNKHMIDDGSLFIVSPFVAFSLIQFAAARLSCERKTVVLRNLSTGIYVLHRPLIYSLLIFGLIFDRNITPAVCFLAPLFVSIPFCLVAYKRKWRISAYLK